jgi:hypothetical protein
MRTNDTVFVVMTKGERLVRVYKNDFEAYKYALNNSKWYRRLIVEERFLSDSIDAQIVNGRKV